MHKPTCITGKDGVISSAFLFLKVPELSYLRSKFEIYGTTINK